MKKIRLADYIDNNIPNLTERTIMWSYELYASAGLWEDVLKTKAQLLRFYETGE
jgi:hypothetical protein